MWPLEQEYMGGLRSTWRQAGAAGGGKWGCNQRKDLEEDEGISRFLGCSGGWGESRLSAGGGKET